MFKWYKKYRLYTKLENQLVKESSLALDALFYHDVIELAFHRRNMKRTIKALDKLRAL
jgi:hypothetical protein